jgi:hypothetical protein
VALANGSAPLRADFEFLVVTLLRVDDASLAVPEI